MLGTVVTTIAGGVGGANAAYADGAGSNAGFNKPIGLVVDAAGTIYLADYSNHLIRKVSAAGGTCASARLQIGKASVDPYASGCQRCESHEERGLRNMFFVHVRPSIVDLNAFCVSVSAFASVSSHVSVSVCLCIYLCLCLFLFLCLSASVSVCICVRLWSCAFSLVWVCVRARA
jgi:hypothetical protein